jgi:hypothetical protein
MSTLTAAANVAGAGLRCVRFYSIVLGEKLTKVFQNGHHFGFITVRQPGIQSTPG